VRISRSRYAVVGGLSLALAAAAAQPALAGKPSAPTTGSGTVFSINPVQSTGNQNLTDDKDANSPAFAPAYRQVVLTDLAGTGYLDGAYANVRGNTGDQAYSPTSTYSYDRSDDRFEQVMAYYWVTAAQKYIQGLGFTGDPNALPAVNKESQDVRINQWGQDNSYSWDKHDVIRLGKGGVDDGEDGEVIVHEYGHAVHDAQVPGYGTSLDAGAIGEAFGDYLAVTVGLEVAGRHPSVDPACVADWDSVSYDATKPTCLRNINLDIKLENRRNAVHYDGQIWSRALWDIRNGLGARTADRIIINAQFRFEPDTSFRDAALHTVATAEQMHGASAAAVVRKAFEDRHIL
jgi:zinc metalloprotease ZmpB